MPDRSVADAESEFKVGFALTKRYLVKNIKCNFEASVVRGVVRIEIVIPHQPRHTSQ